MPDEKRILLNEALLYAKKELKQILDEYDIKPNEVDKEYADFVSISNPSDSDIQVIDLLRKAKEYKS